jgi:hypothetical protein
MQNGIIGQQNDEIRRPGIPIINRNKDNLTVKHTFTKQLSSKTGINVRSTAMYH